MCVCQELKSILPFADTVQVNALVLSGYNINEPVLLHIPMVLGHSQWWCNLDLMEKGIYIMDHIYQNTQTPISLFL